MAHFSDTTVLMFDLEDVHFSSLQSHSVVVFRHKINGLFFTIKKKLWKTVLTEDLCLSKKIQVTYGQLSIKVTNH